MEFWRTSELRALRQMEGRYATTVAAALGRSPRAVHDMARCQGMPVPRQPHARYWPATTKRRARQLRANGNTVNQISAALGVRRWVYEGSSSMTSIHVKPVFSGATDREKEQDRQRLASEIARFVASGGKVQILGNSGIDKSTISRRQVVEGGQGGRAGKKAARA